ncbi:MAG: hypothetical protein AB4041_09830 [Microcystaceae cyanobacterium]
MIQKLFGGKKQEYFLELNDAKGTQSPEEPVKSPKIEAEPTKTESQPKAKAVEKAEKPAKTSKKSAKTVSQPKKETEPTPTPVPESTQSNGKTDPQSAEFATKYLLVPTGSRRRPGPSLNTFKTMAREVKIPRS